MIVLDNISKMYAGQSSDNHVLQNINLIIRPGDSVGICGANGVGKSTLMKLISGVEQPSSGKIRRSMSVSWPIGFSQAFQSNLTGSDNAKFIARIYGKDEQALLAYVEDFAQLGVYMEEPIRTYSAGMGARLAFGISLAIAFDCYLVDEVTGVGDERFQARAEQALQERRAQGTLIMASHDTSALFRYCTSGLVVYAGSVTAYETIQEAAEVHHRLQSFPQQQR